MAFVRLGAEDDAVGLHEILNGGAFAEKFRIVDDFDLVLGVFGGDGGDLRTGARGNGRFDHEGLGAVGGFGDGFGGGEEVLEIVAAAFDRGCADGEEDGAGLARGLGGVGVEGEAAVGDFGFDCSF